MSIYWIELEVGFHKPMPVNEEDSDIATTYANGFIQQIGCTADSEEGAKQMVSDYLINLAWLDLQMSKVNYDRIGIISDNDVQSDIYEDNDIRDSIISNPFDKGIWYISGKAFFADSVKDDDYYEVEVTDRRIK